MKKPRHGRQDAPRNASMPRQRNARLDAQRRKVLARHYAARYRSR